jgi:hypothetical protein
MAGVTWGDWGSRRRRRKGIGAGQFGAFWIGDDGDRVEAGKDK